VSALGRVWRAVAAWWQARRRAAEEEAAREAAEWVRPLVADRRGGGR